LVVFSWTEESLHMHAYLYYLKKKLQVIYYFLALFFFLLDRARREAANAD